MIDFSKGDVQKSGTRWLNIAFERGTEGLLVLVQTDPRIEDLMKAVSTQRAPQNPNAWARSWLPYTDPVSKAQDRLEVYSIDRNFPDNGDYTVNLPGYPLYAPDQFAGINLSFLRIVGIGYGGVKFIVVGPCSKTYAKELKAQVLRGCASFVRDYMIPFHIELTISEKNY